jgi:hypothetical protein
VSCSRFAVNGIEMAKHYRGSPLLVNPPTYLNAPNSESYKSVFIHLIYTARGGSRVASLETSGNTQELAFFSSTSALAVK